MNKAAYELLLEGIAHGVHIGPGMSRATHSIAPAQASAVSAALSVIETVDGVSQLVRQSVRQAVRQSVSPSLCYT